MKHTQPFYQPDGSAPSSASTQHAKKKSKVRPFRVTLSIIVLAVVFMSGIFVGNGRVTTAFNHLTPVNKQLPEKLNYDSVQTVYDSIKDNYDGQLDQTKLIDGLKSGLAEATGDPYTTYFNPKDAQKFTEQLTGTFTGIGAELGKDAQGNLIVISPIAGFPADKAGLRAQDIIAQVNGETTAGMSIDDAVTKIRGPKGTTVKLDIIRNKSQQLSITITRDSIKIASVKSEILDGNIGYLQITQFSDDTVKLANEAADKFKAAKVNGVILDLRGDPGGLLDAAVGVSSLWLPQGKTVLLEKRNNVVDKTYMATGGDELNGIKTVVLIDGGSASASEITAGALRDNKAATLIGDKSFGKGSVQQIINLGDGSELKVTIAHWFTPNGTGINKVGIKPDQSVKLSDDDIKNKNDKQKQAALDFLKK